MTFSSILALLGVMIVLAAVPGASVMAVVSRSLASGFSHGLVTVAGIVVADLVFILIAVIGLTVIAEAMGDLFVLVKYMAAAYLIWFGVGLWRSKSETEQIEGIKEPSWWSNFLCGLFITLGDQKAIIFYLGLFPAFVDLSSVSMAEIGIIMLVATLAVGGVKLIYAYLADRARLIFNNSRAKKAINITAGSLMMVTGIYLVVGA